MYDIDMGVNRRQVGYAFHSVIRVNETRTFRPAVCHPDREHDCRGLCKPCVQRWRRWLRNNTLEPPGVLVALGMCRNGRNPHERLTEEKEWS